MDKVTKAAAAAEIKRLRSQAKNEKIPQEARNEMLDRANEIEYKFYEKKLAVKLKQKTKACCLRLVACMLKVLR